MQAQKGDVDGRPENAKYSLNQGVRTILATQSQNQNGLPTIKTLNIYLFLFLQKTFFLQYIRKHQPSFSAIAFLWWRAESANSVTWPLCKTRRGRAVLNVSPHYRCIQAITSDILVTDSSPYEQVWWCNIKLIKGSLTCWSLSWNTLCDHFKWE